MTRTESVTKIVFYFAISSTLIALGPALLVWTAPSVGAVPTIVALVAAGTIAQLCMTRAYQLAPAAEVGPFIYGSVAFAALFDWLIFARYPDAWSSAGTLLVIVAGVMALRSHRRRQKSASRPG